MKRVFLLFFCTLLLGIFAAESFAETGYSDPATDFDAIENPTADDLLQVPNPTLDDFNRLSAEEQQQYLLIEYNTDLAAAYVSTSDFTSKNDRVIGQQYYAEEPQHINDDPEGFTLFLQEEGVRISLVGQVIDYDEKGNLYGNNQKINLNAFKNSPAADQYRIVVSKNSNIQLYTMAGKEPVLFTGTLEVHNSGRFILREGTINQIAVKNGYFLEFEEGDIVGGTVTSYGGIEFEEPAVIRTRDFGNIIMLDQATVASVAPETTIKVEGNIRVENYNKIGGTLTVPAGNSLYVNNIGVVSSAPEDMAPEDIEVRFGDASSTEMGTTFVRFTDDSIMLNGYTARLGFSAQDYAAGKDVLIHTPDVIVVSGLGTTTLSTDGKGITVSGKRSIAIIGDERYTVKEGRVYKSIDGEAEPVVVGELPSDGFGTNIGVPFHFIPEEEGGVALTLDNELTSLYEETGKPTVRGTMYATTDLAKYELTGDVEGFQERLDAIDQKLQKGEGVSVEDQEFLVSVYSAVSIGGYVKAGSNAGTALRHYFTGNGEPLEVDSDMFEDSTIVQSVMSDMEDEIKGMIKKGTSEGTFSSFSCGCVEERDIRHREIEEGKIYSVSDGKVIGGGIISTHVNIDPDLYYTNHNFPLAVQWEKKPDGTIEATWSVDDTYDFKRVLMTEDVLLSENVKVPVLFSDKDVLLTDGIAAAMAGELGLAKPFNVHTEWKTTLIR